ERVTRTFALRAPEPLREGRTVEALRPGSRTRLQIRYPASRNAELDALLAGAELDVDAAWVRWEDLAERATLEVG
ncbi:MAG TPA: hypothetical protein PKA64_23535, partial [Myxococcota bacterium]|nr:hypothetical protein [Myxococcota bacterium]